MMILPKIDQQLASSVFGAELQEVDSEEEQSGLVAAIFTAPSSKTSPWSSDQSMQARNRTLQERTTWVRDKTRDLHPPPPPTLSFTVGRRTTSVISDTLGTCAISFAPLLPHPPSPILYRSYPNTQTPFPRAFCVLSNASEDNV
nr:hypothetical protein BgiMline_024798 [Biomphalaria glabrata]